MAFELFSVQVIIPSLDLLFWCSKIHFASSALHIDAFEWYSVWLCSYTDDANVYFHWTNICIRIHMTKFQIADRLSLATLKDLDNLTHNFCLESSEVI